MTDLQLARIGNLTHDTFHKGRLSFAVLAYECHLLSSLDGQRHMVEDGMRTIVLAHLVADDGIVARTQTRREFQMHRGVVDLVNLDGHDLLQLLNFLLHLHGLSRLITEALNEVLHLCHFLLLVFVGSDLLLATFLTKHDVLVVFHLIVDHSAAGDFQRAVRHIIYKCTVVTH